MHLGDGCDVMTPGILRPAISLSALPAVLLWGMLESIALWRLRWKDKAPASGSGT
jgi:hypothetical protein